MKSCYNYTKTSVNDNQVLITNYPRSDIIANRQF